MELKNLKNKLKIFRIFFYTILIISILAFTNIATYGNNAPYKNICNIIEIIGLFNIIICPIFIKKLKSKIENIENIEIALKDRKDSK